jgi:ethanolamine ammonia-lyase small subunit
MNSVVRPDPWQQLRQLTAARIALGRSGSGLPTRALLAFDVAHALARDAVHQPLDVALLAAQWHELAGESPLRVSSRAGNRVTYLQRPDLGRQLDAASAARLAGLSADYDLAIVVADGLSAPAAQNHALAVVATLRPLLAGLTLAPLVIAEQGRVALGDEIGASLGARLVLVLLGERPGLSSPDSLGAYLTFDPCVGRLDAERNCVSNIRPGGLPPAEAADKLAWLIREALSRRLTGIALKDEASLRLVEAVDGSERD